MTDTVKVFSSETEDYHHAFQIFLDHTDQKHKANAWIDAFIQILPERRLFLDAGAGNGKVTAWFTEKFGRTIALEPNPSLCRELRTTCPRAEVHGQTILGATVEASADFVLASHVFYYIPREEWAANLLRLASWLAPKGALVVMLQNAGTDCMGMLGHFHDKRFDLNVLAADFEAAHGGKYNVRMETVDSHVTTRDFESAYVVAEFMMNLLPMPRPPKRSDLEGYVERHFKAKGGGYRFSCHQDFMQIRHHV